MATLRKDDGHQYSVLPTSPQSFEGCREAVMLRDDSKRKQWRNSLMTVGNITMFLLTLTMYAKMYADEAKSPDGTLNAKLRATSSYSPVFDLIDLEPSVRRINGTVSFPENPSIARQFPNMQADTQWEDDIDLIRPIPITREQIVMMGKDPETVAKLEDKDWGLGDNAYVAALDIFHNLHCLNTLRRAAYGAYYNISIDANNRGGHVEGHLNHCADILFQHISCSNNLNLVTRNWREGAEYPFPDFSINKYCINYEKLLVWHKDVGLDIEHYIATMKKPKGAKEKSAKSL